MQPNPFPLGSVLGNSLFFNGDLSAGGGSRALFLVPLLLFQGDGMDLSKVGEKILSSVRSARSLGLLPPPTDRPEVPARAAAAAAVARALSGLSPEQRFSLPSSSEELNSIYGSRPQTEAVPELEDEFYEEDFDPTSHILKLIPAEENDLGYFEEQAALRLVQLDRVAEQLSRNVMEHHEVMVKGMNLVRELDKDLKIANVICMNGRRHINSSINEVSRDLIVNTNSKKKQALLDVLPILTELCHARDMQWMLESLVDEGNYCKAFQVLSEYLQILDSYSELSAVQEMSRGVEVWLGRTLQKLDSLLLGVCQEFKEQAYINVVDAYALIGDVSGLAEKMQSFFMQEVISETHSVLKSIVLEDDVQMHNSRLTYSDLCVRIPEPKFRECLLKTLAVLFNLMCSYHEIMSYHVENEGESEIPCSSGQVQNSATGNSGNSTIDSSPESINKISSSSAEESRTINMDDSTGGSFTSSESQSTVAEARDNGSAASSSGSPWYHLRKDATTYVSQTLFRGCRNLWQLTTSRVSVLLSSAAVSTTSIHQFLKNYEDLTVFILAGEAFCGIEAVEFRQKLKAVCENYYVAFHRQSIHALKMVLEKETWVKLPPDTVQVISFAGLVGDGAALIVSSNSTNSRVLDSGRSANLVGTNAKKSGFSHWLNAGNPFSLKLNYASREGHDMSSMTGTTDGEYDGRTNSNVDNKVASESGDVHHTNGTNHIPEEENEDLLADFIDEDSQLPSRISKTDPQKNNSSHWNDDEITQTGSSLCLLRSMDKYARLMQKLEIMNVEFFKGICQLFDVFFHFVYEVFGQQNSNSGTKASTNSLNYRLKIALMKLSQNSEEWIKPQLTSFLPSSPAALSHGDVMPICPPNFSGTSFSLKERCTAADAVSLVARILLRSRTHLQSMLLQSNVVEDFYVHMVGAVPDLVQQIHRTTARLLLHINGYSDRISNAKWEVKEIGLEHNGYVDLLLGEFKHYKTRLAHGGIKKEVQDVLLAYGVEIVAETLIEGLSRVKRCTDEGRALMSLDLQVLINGLQHFVPIKVKPKLQIVEAFIKAYYLPETEYVHWAASHPEYSKSQVVGLVNLVSTMKGWKRKTRLEVIERIESGGV